MPENKRSERTPSDNGLVPLARAFVPKEILATFPRMNFSWAILNQVILSIGAFLIIVSLASLLEPAAFGNIRYIIAVLAILSFFSLPGISQIMIQQVSGVNKSRILQLLGTQFKWGIVALFGALLISLYYLLTGVPELAKGFLIGGFFAPIANLYLVPGLILAGLKQFQKKVLIDSAIIGGAAVGVAFGAWYTHSLALTLFSYYFMQSVMTFAFLVYVIKFLPTPIAAAKDTIIREDIWHGKQLSLFNVSTTFLPSLEKALVFLLLGPTSLAAFTIAVMPVDHIKTAFRNLLQFFIFPYIEYRQFASKVVQRWVIVFWFFAIVVILGLIVFATFLLPIIFPRYEEASRLALLLAFAIIPLPLQLFVFSLFSARRIRILYVYALTTIATSIALFLYLTPTLQLTGAAIAKIAIEFTAGALILFFHHKERHRPSERT